MLESSPRGSLKRVASIFVQHQHKSAHKVANTCAKGPSCLKPVETDYGWTGNLVGAVREVHTRATHTGVVKILELLDGLRDRADCAGNMAPRSGCRLACCHLSYELPVQCWPNQHCRTLTTHDEAAEKHAGSRKGAGCALVQTILVRIQSGPPVFSFFHPMLVGCCVLRSDGIARAVARSSATARRRCEGVGFSLVGKCKVEKTRWVPF
jgi:hypothetical protein